MRAIPGNPPALPIERGSGAARALVALAALAVLAWAPAASAEIYGWVDASGTVTYSNLPPPKGAQLTDVIHEQPLSSQAVAEAAHRAEVSALNDRIRLLELEMARSRREVADYPAPPVAPAGVGCGPDAYADCSGQWGPYYTTGLLYGTGGRFPRNLHGGNYGGNHGGGHPGHWKPPSFPGGMHIAASPSGTGHPGRR